MANQVAQMMNFEQFLRGSLNASSKKAPKSLAEALYAPDIPTEFKGTLKNRTDSLEAAAPGIMDGGADESFSVPITEEQERYVDELTRQFYENAGYELYRKDGHGLSDSYFFRNNSGDVMVVTYTLPLDNESDRCLVSASKVRVR